MFCPAATTSVPTSVVPVTAARSVAVAPVSNRTAIAAPAATGSESRAEISIRPPRPKRPVPPEAEKPTTAGGAVSTVTV